MTSYFEEFTNAEAVLWNKYLNHPWMNGIREGSLTSDQFQFFLVQDMPYQRDFLNALLITSTRVVDPQAFLTLRDFISAEVEFEADLLDSAGVPWTFERWAAGPSREAYMNHLTQRYSLVLPDLPAQWPSLRLSLRIQSFIKNG